MLQRSDVRNLALKGTDINEHIMTIYNLPVQINAQVIVELGIGESTFALVAAANKTKGQLYSIDINEGGIERSSPGGANVLRKEPRYHYIEGDTRELGKTWDKKIDFLLHDTDHTYETTKTELKLWPQWVRSGGIIFAHDTAHEAGSGMGCRQAYDEFMEEHAKEYKIIHLLDTKTIGGSVLIKL